MPDFMFDRTKSYEENRTDFLESIKDIDAEMAEILIANRDQLISVVRGGERDIKARTTFNEAITEALDSLLKKAEEGEGE